MTFDIAFDRIIGNEGGYTDGAGDPGGETNWGISKRSYPNVDIKGLTRDDAKVLYKRDFWDLIAADNLPSALTFQVLDFAVNSGISTAIRKLQAAVGVADDGHWGPVSAAAAKLLTPCELILSLSAERLEYMTKLKNWPSAGRGWARRIVQNLKYAANDDAAH